MKNVILTFALLGSSAYASMGNVIVGSSGTSVNINDMKCETDDEMRECIKVMEVQGSELEDRRDKIPSDNDKKIFERAKLTQDIARLISYQNSLGLILIEREAVKNSPKFESVFSQEDYLRYQIRMLLEDQ